MIASEFKHLKKEQLKKRLKILNILVYLFAAIAIASFVVFFTSSYKYHWSWLLIGLSYTLLPVNYVGQMRRMRKEILKREDRLKQKQEDASGAE